MPKSNSSNIRGTGGNEAAELVGMAEEEAAACGIGGMLEVVGKPDADCSAGDGKSDEPGGEFINSA